MKRSAAAAGTLLLTIVSVASPARADDGPPPPATQPATTQAAAPTRALVAFTAESITLDGRLDEPVWQRAEAYTLARVADRRRWRGMHAVYEASTVRFVRDDRQVYVALDFVDENLVQTLDEDYQHHYLTGDVAELFLKPADAPHYWEFYATPHGRRTVFFYPRRKRMERLDEYYDLASRLQVAVHADGTVNDPADVDRGWTAELAVPLDELAAAGVPFDEANRWLVLVGRYNYGRRGAWKDELSSFPAQPRSDFHAYEHWLPLELEPRPEPPPSSPPAESK